MSMLGGLVPDRVRSSALPAVLALPSPLLRRLAGAPVELGGFRLDPEVQLVLSARPLHGADLETVSISRARRTLRDAARAVRGRLPIGAVTDRTIDGPGGPLVLRFYTPQGITDESPALVFLHGGGFVLGDLDTHDALCRAIAETAQVRVVAVDYRRAPEGPFPAAFDDAWAAWRWVTAHAAALAIAPDLVAVGGDGGGATLAAFVAQEAVREGAVVPAAQLLLYPHADLLAPKRASATTVIDDDCVLVSPLARFTAESLFVGDEAVDDRRLRPLRHVGPGQPPAVVVTAGLDPVRDDGLALVAALRSADVGVEHLDETTLPHGFGLLVGTGRVVPQAVARAALALQRALT